MAPAAIALVESTGGVMASLTIPAAYLDDARAAMAIEIGLDSEGVKANATGDPEDLASDLEILNRTVRLNSQLVGADTDIEVHAEQDNTSSPLVYMLDEMVRVFAARLDEVKEYGPVPMDAVVDLADRLRWAAREATRIDRESIERESTSKGVA